jgi:hypothetical protein
MGPINFITEYIPELVVDVVDETIEKIQAVAYSIFITIRQWIFFPISFFYKEKSAVDITTPLSPLRSPPRPITARPLAGTISEEQEKAIATFVSWKENKVIRWAAGYSSARQIVYHIADPYAVLDVIASRPALRDIAIARKGSWKTFEGLLATHTPDRVEELATKLSQHAFQVNTTARALAKARIAEILESANSGKELFDYVLEAHVPTENDRFLRRPPRSSFLS